MEIANENKKYHTSSHLVYGCQYHVIFCPKYRRRVLVDGIDTRLKEIFYETAAKYQFTIIEMEIMPDYVHLLMDCNPKFGVMNCIRRLKSASVNKIHSLSTSLKATEKA